MRKRTHLRADCMGDGCQQKHRDEPDRIKNEQQYSFSLIALSVRFQKFVIWALYFKLQSWKIKFQMHRPHELRVIGNYLPLYNLKESVNICFKFKNKTDLSIK